MPTFAANLSFMYQEVEFLDRFQLAAQDGFQWIEFLYPYSYKAADIKQRLNQYKLRQHLFNISPGDESKGEKGLSIFENRQADFTQNLENALTYAKALQVSRLHLMAGILPSGADQLSARKIYLQRIRQAANAAQSLGIDIVIEPINTRNAPGYFLNYQKDAVQIITELAIPNVKLMMDLFHAQIMEGDLEKKTAPIYSTYWPYSNCRSARSTRARYRRSQLSTPFFSN
jgi:hydroxypyruvate isomerase